MPWFVLQNVTMLCVILLTVILLSFILLSTIMWCAVLLRVIIRTVILLSVILWNVILQFHCAKCCSSEYHYVEWHCAKRHYSGCCGACAFIIRIYRSYNFD
jgi:hypothetical protein